MSHKISTTDKNVLTFTLSALLISALVLGIVFTFEDTSENDTLPSLDVILSKQKSLQAPDKADYLAQNDQQGGGESEKNVRPQNIKTGVAVDDQGNHLIEQVENIPTLVEVKNKRKSNIFPNEMSNTAVYHRLFKMFGGYFQGSSNGNIVTDDSYTLSFTTQVSRIVLMSQCHMSDGQTGLPPSFYKIIEEYCAQRNVNSFDYPFVISMLVASVKWNDPTFVKNLDVDIQTWFADRFKNDLKAFAKPVKKIKLRKKAA